SGSPVDHRSDIFSLGVLVYEMVTGHAPFRGRHPIEVLHAVINDSPAPIARMGAAAPQALQAILDRALAKEPSDRYPTMAAMRDELKSLLRRLSRPAEPGDSGDSGDTPLPPRR